MSFVSKEKQPILTPEQVARQVHAVSLERSLDELASVLALMCIAQESNYWCPWNRRDPESEMFSHDSESDDNRSVGYFQQQKGPNGEPWWGSTRDMMTLPTAANTFLDRLSDSYVNADNGISAGRYIQAVQRSGFPDAYAKHWDASWQLLRRALAQPVPLPEPVPPPVPDPAPLSKRPDFQELERYGNGWGQRRRAPINFFLHTEEGDASAEGLAHFCDGSNNVSYHYTLRDRILCDVVNTDNYSWSVLSANVFSINLCYAGSRAAWNRDEWMKRRDDIEISAYIAVQDCRKYGIPMKVITPPYSEMPGISDHRYVTMELGEGTHVDLGGPLGSPWTGFPWDYFITCVAKYADVAQEVTPVAGVPRTDRQLIEEIWNKVCAYPDELGGRYPARGLTRDSDAGVDDGFGMVLHNEAHSWDGVQMFLATLVGEPTAVARWKRLADGDGPAGNDAEAVQIAKHVYAAIPKEFK